MGAFATQNDAELVYQPSLFLQHLAVYLPFNFDMFVNPATNQRSIYITDMNPAAALYGYTDMSTVDYSQCVLAPPTILPTQPSVCKLYCADTSVGR